MALPQVDCNIDDDVCCPSAFDIANYICNVGYTALVGCIREDCRKEFTSYVTVGGGDDGLSDCISVSWRSAAPSPGSRGQTGRQFPISLYRAMFDIRLRESGWPIARVDGRTINAPPAAEQHAIARHAFSHGERLYRAMGNLVSSPTMWLSQYIKPAHITLSALTPMNPLGGVVGWLCTIECDMPWGMGG